MQSKKLRTFVSIALLSSLAFVLMLIKIPTPFSSFLTIDFSDIPALIAALLFGPISAIIVEVIKNILDYFISGSETGIPIGHFANLLSGIFFVLPTYYVYKYNKTKRGMTIGLIVGTVILAILMSVLNYFVILPAYLALMHYELPKGYVIAAVLPFNILKGISITILFMLLFVRLQNWLEKNSLVK
ncbi:ECF transporter S component [Bacillus sp. FJAT-49736]|uniref:ECF transporter S component n=1 Tax=Bacillus sp. FJAT-49736 TaxID=2833582 RepID=UPI001BC9C584|nr:ECF transporter S component [Bacillus sp. FJAT-49736]MBS4173315.1 ECF transporter S component [Bacillus sp. FJAT-49736]